MQDLDKVIVAPDEDDLYGRSVAEHLNKLTPKANGIAKHSDPANVAYGTILHS